MEHLNALRQYELESLREELFDLENEADYIATQQDNVEAQIMALEEELYCNLSMIEQGELDND